MTVSDIAGLIAAIAFVLLVGFLAAPLIKLAHLFDATAKSVEEATDHAVPILDEARETVRGANVQLERVDSVTTSAAQVSRNVSALTDLYASVLGKPLIAVASAAYGIKRGLRKIFREPKHGAEGNGEAR